MIGDHDREAADHESDDEADHSKLSPDDPSVKLSTGARRLRPLPIALAVGVAGLLVGGIVIIKQRSATSTTISEEPTVVVRANDSIPSFLEEPPRPVAREAARLEAPRAEPAPPRPENPDHSLKRSLSAVDTDAQRRADRLAELDEEARSAGGFFKTSAAPSARAGAVPLDGVPSSLPGMPVAGGAGSLGASAPSNGAEWDPNLQDHKNAFLRGPREAEGYLLNTVQRPISRFELKRSAVIPATLITAINSDLPGPITAQVRERVYDTVTGDHLLIPQGARLFGWYDSKVVWGQERVLMCWEAILFPNGSSINLECMPAADLQGQAGLTDEVDNHWDRLAAAVGFSTVLSLGAQAAAGDPSGFQPNLAQRAAANASGQINNAGQAIVSRQLNLQPTITVRAGFPVNLVVTKDIVLEPYVEGP